MSWNMANRPATVQMAVTSENQDFKGNMNRDELDCRAGSSSPRTSIDGVPKKKGTFKITSVKLNDTQDGDSMDDLDESHTEMTEDYSSEILDMSRATDYGQDTPSVTEDIPLTNQTARDNQRNTDMHSRFRVVKIETKEPFKRGRWHCHDFLDPQPSAERSETKVNDDANSGSSSAGSSIHYVHGVDDPTKNPLIAGATGTIHAQIPEGHIAGPDVFQPIHPAPNTAVNPQVSASYVNDIGQGLINTTLCQSHSHQSISSVASMDNVQMKGNLISTGQSLKADGVPVPHSSQIISGQNIEIDIPNTGMYMPHYSTGAAHPGSSISIQSVYPQASIPSSSQMPSDPSSVQIPHNLGQDQASTYQTFVHLGQQIPNPGISQSGHSETMPPSEISNVNIPQPVSESSRDLSSDPSTNINEFNSGMDNVTGDLDKDANVIPNAIALSPALVAAVGDLQSPTEEDKR